MRRLSLITAFAVCITGLLLGQSPHGRDFEIDCAKCHTETAWGVLRKPMDFNHSATAFPLTGSHTTVSCKSCHTNLQFNPTPTECMSCHQDVHESTLGNNCSGCHTTRNWIVNFGVELHQTGRFPLLGAHRTAPCESCHTSVSKLRFEPMNTECFECHKNDYVAARNPNHVQSGFPTDCRSCHGTNSYDWVPASFDHAVFPLTGGHSQVQCSSCHTSGQYAGTSSVCATCHTPDFQTAVDPPHNGVGFSTDCAQCHTTNRGWAPAGFPSHDLVFPLTGAHAAIKNDCRQCHSLGYTAIMAMCYFCHQPDYAATVNPPHLSAGFPQQCETCHTTSAWTPSTFDHDGLHFPIYSGRHRNEWNACRDCHTTPSNFTIFSCVDCHEHNRTDMDREHRDVANYVYNSLDCLSCHPDGEANMPSKRQKGTL